MGSKIGDARGLGTPRLRGTFARFVLGPGASELVLRPLMLARRGELDISRQNESGHNSVMEGK